MSLTLQGINFHPKKVGGIFRAAHSIKGGAGNLAARPLWSAAQRLEQLSTENKGEDCTQALQQVNQEYAALKSYINGLVGLDAVYGEKTGNDDAGT